MQPGCVTRDVSHVIYIWQASQMQPGCVTRDVSHVIYIRQASQMQPGCVTRDVSHVIYIRQASQMQPGCVTCFPDRWFMVCPSPVLACLAHMHVRPLACMSLLSISTRQKSHKQCTTRSISTGMHVSAFNQHVPKVQHARSAVHKKCPTCSVM
jgi:hypothetical protein